MISYCMTVVYTYWMLLPFCSKCWKKYIHCVGHERIQKTIWDFHVTGLSQIIWEFIKGCSACQRNKIEHLHPAGLLQPLVVPRIVWADIAMDFVEGLPKVHGKSVILTVVDRCSKYAHFIALSHPYTANSVARAFFDEIVRLHGMPSSIVSDCDPIFTSNFWKEMFCLARVKLQLSSAFHSQSDGQLEVVNHIITMYLRCLSGDRPKQWVQWLPWAEYCYNSSYQTALRATPFHVVYGCDPPALLVCEPGAARVVAVEQQMVDRDEFWLKYENVYYKLKTS